MSDPSESNPQAPAVVSSETDRRDALTLAIRWCPTEWGVGALINTATTMAAFLADGSGPSDA